MITSPVDAASHALPDQLTAAFYARTQPLPGGHLAWTGARDSRGIAVLTHQQVRFTAQRLAFVIANGVDPVGRVQAGCEHQGCVQPSHIDDFARRQRDRGALRLVLGTRPRKPACRRGHDQGVHGGLTPDGRARCIACNHSTK